MDAIVETVRMSGALFESSLKKARLAGLKEAAEILKKTPFPGNVAEFEDAVLAQIESRIAALEKDNSKNG